jgi:hypothetical protein
MHNPNPQTIINYYINLQADTTLAMIRAQAERDEALERIEELEAQLEGSEQEG